MAIIKKQINKTQAAKAWGGVLPGYWVTSESVQECADEKGDCIVTLISVGSGYEIDSVEDVKSSIEDVVLKRLQERSSSHVDYFHIESADGQLADLMECEEGELVVFFEKDDEIWMEVV